MTVLVTGATGNIGRMLVDHLIATGASDIRALTNKPEIADLPDGVEVVKGYLGRVESLPAAFEGVDSVYLAPLEKTVRQVLDIAKSARVRYVVDLAGPPGNWWYPISRAVEESGLEWTHLWPGEFMENATMWAPQIRATRSVGEPYPNSANAPIAMDDIAAVAAACLTEPGHIGKAYTLTGPESLTRTAILRHIGDALGENLRFDQVSRRETIDALTPAMGDFAVTYVDGLAAQVDSPQAVGTTAADLTGRSTTFAQWARENVKEFS